MMRAFRFMAAFAAITLGCYAAELTTITDTVYTADGSVAPAGSTITISWPRFTSVTGRTVPAASQVVTIAGDGTFTIALEPTDTAVPAFTYVARYDMPGQSPRSEYWSVPTSTTPKAIYQVAAAVGQNTIPAVRLAIKGAFGVFDGTNMQALTPGANGTALISDSTQPLGYRWGAVTGGASYTFTGPLNLAGSTVSLAPATGSVDGYLAHADWARFDGKQDALTFTGPLHVNSGSVSVDTATASRAGVITSADWSTFNAKQGALSFTGPLSLSGGIVSIPAADATHDGYLTAADWARIGTGGGGTGASDAASLSYVTSGGNTVTQAAHNARTIYFCEQYGACNGTDDTAAWNTAIAQANANSIEMRIPNGKTVTLHDPTLPSNISVVCGAGATIKDSGSDNWSVLQIKFVHDVSIHHCHVDQNGAQQTNGVNVMIYTQGATNFTLDDVWLTNSGTPSPNTGGILIYASNGGDINGLHVDHTILGTHVMINTYSANQRSASAQTLFGSNDLDNLLLIQAATPGTSGNSMTATIVNDGAIQPLSFSGTSTALTIHLATNASSVSTSTAASIIAAFQGNSLQRYFRVTTYDTATGIVAAASTQTLAGGVDAFDKIRIHDSVLDGSQSDGIHVEAAGQPAGTYCNVEVSNNTITNIWDWQDYLATDTAHSGQNGNGIDVDSCNGVLVQNNNIDHVEFSGIRFYNTWDSTARGNTVRHAGEQSLYSEFNSQGNTFEDNKVLDSMFGTNDNNAEQRTALRLNRYIHNYYRNIQGTGIVCNACIAEENTFDGVVEGVLLGGGGSGGYNSQIINNTCIVSQDTTLPGLLDCISYGNGYGGTDALIQGNHTVGGTPVFGHIWGAGNPSGHITSIVLGNPTTIKYTDASGLANGNYVCPFGIEIHSTSEFTGHCYVASSVTGSSFTIPVDSTGFRPWIAYQSLANSGSANGWRFPSFWYDGNLTTSPSALNSHVTIRDEEIKDAVKGTPKVGSHVWITDDDCSSGALSNAGSGAGTTARYTSTGWTCSN